MLTGVNRLNEKLHLRYMCAARTHKHEIEYDSQPVNLCSARWRGQTAAAAAAGSGGTSPLSRSLSLTRSGSDKSPRNVMQSHKPINIEFWWVN